MNLLASSVWDNVKFDIKKGFSFFYGTKLLFFECITIKFNKICMILRKIVLVMGKNPALTIAV